MQNESNLLGRLLSSGLDDHRVWSVVAGRERRPAFIPPVGKAMFYELQCP